MINLLLEKYINYSKLRVQSKTRPSNACELRNGFELKARLLSKYKVFAISGNDDNEDKDKTQKQQLSDEEVVTKYSEVFDKNSKDYIDFHKSLSVWQSFRYFFSRKVDTKSDAYQRQFAKEGETGLDRIGLMWSEHLAGEDNPEVRFIMRSAGTGMLVGLVYGGLMGNRSSVQDFIRRHNEHVFRGEMDAKRRIRDSMYLQFVSRGWRWCWRMGVFCGLLSALSTTAVAYRNDVYFGDFAASGAMVCGLWKAKLGARATLLSATLGAVFGVMFAGSLKLALLAMHTSVPEYRHWRHTRYLGHLTVEEYSDGSTEYTWDTEGLKPSQLLYKNTANNDNNSNNTNKADSDIK